MATDQKRLPTLLAFEAVSAIVSTLPVKTFSLPILKSTQLSFLMVLSIFLAGLLEVKRGDSHEGQPLQLHSGDCTSSPTMSASSSGSSIEAKQGWANASKAVILSWGDFLSILIKRLRASESTFLYSSPSKVMLLALFWARTSLQVFPGKALTPSNKMWKMRPKLKMSQMGSYLVFISLMLITSGATQPGVPQRTNRYSSASANSARPKSAITHSQLPQPLKMRFSGLRSRCMMRFECISLRPWRIEQTMSLTSKDLNLYLALILSQSCPPSKSSTTMQREFSDSKTSWSFMQNLWLRLRMIQISLIRHSFPLSSLQAASFEKALTAKFLPHSNFYARQTEAKFPFPIFFLGLNCSWKPLWLSLPFRIYRKVCRSGSDLRVQAACSSCFSKVMVQGERVKANLRSKSKGITCLPLELVSMRHLSWIDRETSPSAEWAGQAQSSLPGFEGWCEVNMGVIVSIPIIIQKKYINLLYSEILNSLPFSERQNILRKRANSHKRLTNQSIYCFLGIICISFLLRNLGICSSGYCCAGRVEVVAMQNTAIIRILIILNQFN